MYTGDIAHLERLEMPAKKAWTRITAKVVALPRERAVLIEFGARLDAVKMDAAGAQDLVVALKQALRDLASARTP